MAALCAMITRNIETQVASSGPTSFQPTPLGSPSEGRPLGTVPRVETPWASRSKPQLIAIAPTTATRPPGIIGIHFSNTISVAITASETASVASDVSGISFSVSQNLITVPLNWSRSTLGDATPSMPAELAQRHLDADAREEADEHRPRDEVRQEAELRDPREDQEAARDQRREARVREPLARARLQAGDAEAGDALRT